MKTPEDKSITMTFHSHQTKRREEWWRARVSFPPGAGPDSMLEIEVTDGLGAPVRAAVLELAGMRLDVAGGKAGMRYADFVAGKHEKALWLYRDGMDPLPGALTFA